LNITEKYIHVRNEIDIALARHLGRDLADILGFGTVSKHCLITSISELAANIYVHVGQGTITLNVIEKKDNVGIEVVASDNGPGIDDIEFALKDGFSTRGGLGGGLPGVNRLMSKMEISSAKGEGTVVRAVKWMNEPLFSGPHVALIDKTEKSTVGIIAGRRGKNASH
jgi:serine/threonine-protein kinase RsbT